MRANQFITENAADELADKLPTLKRTDYEAINDLMGKVSQRHGIEPKRLHDLFVRKYGHTPDHWIKQIRQRNEDVTEGEAFEPIDNTQNHEEVQHFIEWAYKALNMQKPYPQITLSNDTEKAQAGHHTGVHVDDKIWVYCGNRNLVDIFRTVFHELVHQRQQQLNMIKDGDSYPGSPIEAMADMMAGKYIKIYGKENPHIFQ